VSAAGVSLTRLNRRRGVGARSTYLVEPPCPRCGSYIVFRMGSGVREMFWCNLMHRYPLFLPIGARP